MTEETTKVTLGEVSRKLDDHVQHQEEFETYLKSKIDDLNFILKVFKWIGWAVTIAGGVVITWTVNNWLNGGR